VWRRRAGSSGITFSNQLRDKVIELGRLGGRFELETYRRDSGAWKIVYDPSEKEDFVTKDEGTRVEIGTTLSFEIPNVYSDLPLPDQWRELEAASGKSADPAMAGDAMTRRKMMEMAGIGLVSLMAGMTKGDISGDRRYRKILEQFLDSQNGLTAAQIAGNLYFLQDPTMEVNYHNGHTTHLGGGAFLTASHVLNAHPLPQSVLRPQLWEFEQGLVVGGNRLTQYDWRADIAIHQNPDLSLTPWVGASLDDRPLQEDTEVVSFEILPRNPRPEFLVPERKVIQTAEGDLQTVAQTEILNSTGLIARKGQVISLDPIEAVTAILSKGGHSGSAIWRQDGQNNLGEPMYKLTGVLTGERRGVDKYPTAVVTRDLFDGLVLDVDLLWSDLIAEGLITREGVVEEFSIDKFFASDIEEKIRQYSNFDSSPVDPIDRIIRVLENNRDGAGMTQAHVIREMTEDLLDSAMLVDPAMVAGVLLRLDQEDYPQDIDEIRGHVFGVQNYLERLLSGDEEGEAPSSDQLQRLFDEFVPIAYQLGYLYEGSVIRDYIFKLLNPEDAREYIRVFEDGIFVKM